MARDQGSPFRYAALVHRRLAALLAFAALFLASSGCAQPQAGRVIAHWDHVVSDLQHAVPAGDGFLLVRRTAVRNAIEWLRPDGTIGWRLYTDHPITRLVVQGSRIWFIEEREPGQAVIGRADLVPAAAGQPPTLGRVEPVADRANWTDLARTSDGRVLAFESLFLSRDIAPSAVKIRDLEDGRTFWQDNFSYHYPIEARTLLLVSPIDRRVRAWRDGAAVVVGELVSTDLHPVARADGAWTAWFGPQAAGSALFLADERGQARPFRDPMGERPIAWLGEDLLVAERDALTGRWKLERLSVPDGLVRAVIPVPAGVEPTSLRGSPSGDFVGLPMGDGSLLVRLADGFLQEFPGVPLTAWRFDPSGARLYLARRDRLQVVDLR